MKRTVAVVVLSMCCLFLASVADAACNPQLKTATIEIDVGDDSFSYPNKTGDPIPCIYRNRSIEVTVNFPDTSPHKHFVVLKDFRALFFVGPPGDGSWVHDFNDPLLQRIIEGATDIGTEIKFENDSANHTVTKTIKLQSMAGPGGPNRLINFTLVIADKNGNEIMTFDPPWGERP